MNQELSSQEDAKMFYDERMWQVIRRMLGKDIPLAVEIGTRYGHWAVGLVRQFNVGRLFCVDTWPEIRWCHAEEWARKLAGYAYVSVFPLRGTSAEWAAIFPHENIDLLFVDDGHRAKDVLTDLQGWWPKVRRGGLVIGHDAHSKAVSRGMNRFFCGRTEKPRLFPCGPEKEKGFVVKRGGLTGA